MARKNILPLSSQDSTYVSSKALKQIKGRRTTLTYTIGGLPPGGIASLYDKLHQKYENNTYKSVLVGTYLIDDSGILKLKNLRDSIYSLHFQEFENLKYNIPDIQVGNPDLFQTTIDTSVPYPVIITGIQAGLDLEEQAFLTVSWILDEHQIEGFYEVWAKKSGGDYYKWTTLYTPQARSYTVIPLDYETLYYILIRTTNSEGLTSANSNIISGTTYENPFSSGVYERDATAPTGATFYYN